MWNQPRNSLGNMLRLFFISISTIITSGSRNKVIILAFRFLRMSHLMNKALKRYFKYRQSQIDMVLNDPVPYQKRLLKEILRNNQNSFYGKKHHFSKIVSYDSYAAAVPVVTYDDLYPYIFRMLEGESNLLVDEPVRWFAKSSGTTNDRSKYIPVTRTYLNKGHLKCTWFTASAIYAENPTCKLFAQKNLIMAGSLSTIGNGFTCGDISAIMMHHYPKIGRRFSTPEISVALTADWDEKIARMVDLCINEKVTLIGGVPTWTLVLIKALLAKSGKSTLTEVWPELRTYMHGGVGFGPYETLFREYMPVDQVTFREVYNASEGYFAVQDKSKIDGMSLLCDHQVFYEFLPIDTCESGAEAIPLWAVELGQLYAIVITTSAGLYRYRIGDIVEFVSISPYKIKVRGRVEQFLNVFGEELIVADTDAAIKNASQLTEAVVKDYTVAPIFMTNDTCGGHEWAIEFEQLPQSLESFQEILDRTLREVNSDYDAKRFGDLALLPLKVQVLENGTVEAWQRRHRKYGRQHKLPRLSNERKLIDSLLSVVRPSINIKPL